MTVERSKRRFLIPIVFTTKFIELVLCLLDHRLWDYGIETEKYMEETVFVQSYCEFHFQIDTV